MKKLIAVMLVCAFMACTVQVAGAATEGRGGFMGFLAGCCFGLRTGGAYNDGKMIHFREWALLIPLVGIVVAVWNGVDGMNGVTTKDLAAQYGAQYY
ncbi:MAG: hypothetical protein V1873_04765 [Verrucomicrobiota bacterium]